MKYIGERKRNDIKTYQYTLRSKFPFVFSRSFSKNSLITSSSPVKVGETLASVDIKSLKKK